MREFGGVCKRWAGGLVIALLAGCGGDLLGPDASSLRDAEARWRAAGITDYVMQLRVSCFCGPTLTEPVAVQVSGGRFRQIFYQSSGTTADTTLFRNYLTVERLFNVLDDALARGADRFEAEYAADTGYPTRVSIDYDQHIADEELGFAVSGLVILEPAPATAPARF